MYQDPGLPGLCCETLPLNETKTINNNKTKPNLPTKTNPKDPEVERVLAGERTALAFSQST